MTEKRSPSIDLADQLDRSLRPWKPWTCPECQTTYEPPLAVYINPITAANAAPDAPRKGFERAEQNPMGL